MKIERISDTQVKVILNHTDLNERDIKVNELAYGSEKISELFKEMMDEAVEKCGFAPESDMNLMIEAIPLSEDSIMIIISKVADIEDLDIRLNLSPRSKNERKFMKRPIIENIPIESVDDEMLIYSFDSLENATLASIRLSAFFSGTSQLYKMNNLFYLIINNDNPEDIITLQNIEAQICEYGNSHPATVLGKYRIVEHGELFIKADAIKILSTI